MNKKFQREASGGAPSSVLPLQACADDGAFRKLLVETLFSIIIEKLVYQKDLLRNMRARLLYIFLTL